MPLTVRTARDPFSELNNYLDSYVTSPTEKKELSEVTKERIRAIVAGHLEPYLQGYITSQNEKYDRPAFITLLQIKIKEKEPKLPFELHGKIRAFALMEYIKRAINGLYRQKGFDDDEIVESNNYNFRFQLMNGLRPALTKDFPINSFGAGRLETLVIHILNKVNKEREGGYRLPPNHLLLNVIGKV
jgi:hypothetical protein